MSYITDEQKENIVKLTNAGVSNSEISNNLSIPLQTIFYWKRILRESGEITIAPKLGRQKSIEFHICETCGQKVKTVLPKQINFTAIERLNIIKVEKEKEKIEYEQAEQRLKDKFGEPELLPPNKNWEY